MADYGELRRRAGIEVNCPNSPDCGIEMPNASWLRRAEALELLDEVSTLTSKLALANRALDEANQSITELHQRLAMADATVALQHERINEAAQRIAQLEATLERERLMAKGLIGKLHEDRERLETAMKEARRWDAKTCVCGSCRIIDAALEPAKS